MPSTAAARPKAGNPTREFAAGAMMPLHFPGQLNFPGNLRAGWPAMAVSALLFAACSGPRGGPIQSETPANDSQARSGGCFSMSAMNCPVEPVAEMEGAACDRLRQCLERQSGSGENIGPRYACDAPLHAEAAGPVPVAALPVSLDFDGVPSHAAYLFVRGDSGWCPGHELLAPQWNHGGYCEADFSFEWTVDRAGDDGNRLYVTSSRVCHMPLDQEEIAAGESDVASQGCSRKSFDLVDGRLLPGDGPDDDPDCQVPREPLAGGT